MSDNTNTLGGLSPEMISELMAGSRTKNMYGPKLYQFNESDSAGVNVYEVEAWKNELKGKSSTTVYQGFVNAAKKAKLEDTIRIIQRNEQVFLLHKERVALVTAEQAINGNGASDDADEE